MEMLVETAVINGIKYIKDENEHVFLVPVTKLGDFRAIDLPSQSSLHVTGIDLNDLSLYFSVVHGGNGYASIFILFSIQCNDYSEGSRRIHETVNAIATIASPNYLDTPRIGADQNDDNMWKHYVTYSFDEELSCKIIVRELAEQIIYALTNAKPSIQAFLCHSSEDKHIVEQFAYRLRSTKSYVWFDKWEIKVGDSIVEKINEGLEKMTHLIIFLSKSSVNKPWVKKELSSALMRKLEDNSVRVMPIKINECDIPVIIKDIKYADCTEDFESGFSQLIADITN